jgi:hypothetical protein
MYQHEASLLGSHCESRSLVGANDPVLHDTREGRRIASHQDPGFRIGMPQRPQRLTDESGEPQGLLRIPARNREEAARSEMVDKIANGFPRVEVVLSQRVCAAGAGDPRVCGSDLDNVVASLATRYEVPPFVDYDPYAWVVIRPSREIGEGVLNDLDHQWV